MRSCRRPTATSSPPPLAEVPAVEHVFPSGANFLLTRVASGPAPPPGWPYALLADNAIYVRDVSTRFPDNRGYWRIAGCRGISRS